MITKKGKDKHPSPSSVVKTAVKLILSTWFWFPRLSFLPSAHRPPVDRPGSSFHHSVRLARPALALLAQALAVAEAEPVPPFCRILQMLASKRRGLFPIVKRFSFPS
jgi:hypothetical protein